MTTAPEIAAPLAGRAMAALYRDLNLHAGLGVPLCRDRVLPGVSTIDVPRTFATDEQALLDGMADQAALAIIRSLLLEETRHREGAAEVRRTP